MLLGAHESIAGGPSGAFDLARRHRAECIQIFTRSARGWRSGPLAGEERARFRERAGESGMPVFAHGSYLVNLATADTSLRQRSFHCVLDELDRCEQLGVRYLIYHLGSAPDRRPGVRRVARMLDEAVSAYPDARTRLLLENSAGQGACLGGEFEEIAEILAACEHGDRLGVCLDTCHAWAMGYDLATRKGYDETMKAFDRAVGVGRILAFHLNDSKRERGSRVDRHEVVGRGWMGTVAFRALVNDRRFADVPGALETPDPRRYRASLALLKSFRRGRGKN